MIAFLVLWVGEGKTYIVQAAILVALLCFVYAVIGVVRMGAYYGFGELVKSVLWRFYISIYNLGHIVERFPTDNFQYGRTLINDLLVVLPGSQTTYMMQLKDIINMQFDGGSLTPSIFGEGYYNWGWPGAIIWPNFIICMVAFLDYFNKSFFKGGLYYVVAYALVGLSVSGLIPSMTNVYIPAFLVYVVMSFVNKYWRWGVK